MHVEDAVEAILALAGCSEALGKVFNVGSTEEVRIVDLANKIVQLVRGTDESNVVFDWKRPLSDLSRMTKPMQLGLKTCANGYRIIPRSMLTQGGRRATHWTKSCGIFYGQPSSKRTTKSRGV